MNEEFEHAKYLFIKAAHDLITAWPEQEVENYPSYLPSFDEFIFDFQEVKPRQV